MITHRLIHSQYARPPGHCSQYRTAGDGLPFLVNFHFQQLVVRNDNFRKGITIRPVLFPSMRVRALSVRTGSI